MGNADASKWDAIYSNNEFGFFPPANVLHQNKHLLPTRGKALDLASGQGRNAVFLSRLGYETHAWDISRVALDKLSEYAAAESLTVNAQLIDLNEYELPQNEFDIIVVSHYLNRNIIENIKQAMANNGLIFYQTFTRNKVDDIGPSNPDYLLKENELLQLFSDFIIHFYREDSDLGDKEHGQRNEAMLVAQKKTSD